MIPKGFPHHLHHFPAEIRPISPPFEPILWHVWCNLAVFWLYHAQKTAFSSRKKLIPKGIPKHAKGFPHHQIAVIPNHIFTAVHTRFTRILACACIFRLGLHMDLHGAGFRNNFGGQEIEKFSIFLLLHKLVRKGFPHHPHHFFRRKSINSTPFGAQFEACIVSFGCVLHAVLGKTLFSQNKNATKPVFHSRI